jgi:hypothetical protein
VYTPNTLPLYPPLTQDNTELLKLEYRDEKKINQKTHNPFFCLKDKLDNKFKT